MIKKLSYHSYLTKKLRNFLTSLAYIRVNKVKKIAEKYKASQHILS